MRRKSHPIILSLLKVGIRSKLIKFTLYSMRKKVLARMEFLSN